MIRSLVLKSGRVPGGPATTIEAKPVNIFVGPNNSGKSRILAEIEQFCRLGRVTEVANALPVILDSVEFDGLTQEQASVAIEPLILGPSAGEKIEEENFVIGSRRGRNKLSKQQLFAVLENPQHNVQAFCTWFLVHACLMLTGPERIGMVNPQSGGDLQAVAQNAFQIVFRDRLKREELRRIIYEAIGSYLVFDPTHLGQIRLRLSKTPPIDENQELALTASAIAFQGAATPIESTSDGIKAFTGILTEVTAGDPRILLIDEPEAFLHPPLASKLGIELARLALKENKRIFVATHSSNFVLGCVQSGAPVNIVRLTHRDGVATSRILESDKLKSLVRNPLLRSAHVLAGLFYEFVVVTESDADRAFYEEVNERLLRFDPSRAVPNCLFLNAQNKHTVPTIVAPLRELGIPTVGIVDVDVFKEGGSVWANLLQRIGIPSMQHQAMSTTRAAVFKAMNESGKDMKRDGGVAILSPGDREGAQNLIGQLAEYGLLVVQGGELESWLKHLGVSSHGPAWLVKMFEAMGDNPDSAEYVKPATGDVWDFLSQARAWCTSPTRKGIPG